MKFQREVALLLGLLVLSKGEEISSRRSEEGEMVERAVQLEQLTDHPVEQPLMENRSEENFLSNDMRSYAKNVTVKCSIPSCFPLMYHSGLEFLADCGSPYSRPHSCYLFFTQIKDTQPKTFRGPFEAHFELDGPADEQKRCPAETCGHEPKRDQNPTGYSQQYHYKGETDRYYFLQILSLNGRKTSDDLQFHEYEMKYKAKRGSTYTLFDFRDGEKYSEKWSAVLDSDGVNGNKPAYVNWKYDIKGDEFLIEIADHEK